MGATCKFFLAYCLQELRMSLDQAPTPLKPLDAPITFIVWYDYI